jgi:hypothetical protein
MHVESVEGRDRRDGHGCTETQEREDLTDGCSLRQLIVSQAGTLAAFFAPSAPSG